MPDRPHRVCSRMHTAQPISGVCQVCKRIAVEDLTVDLEPVVIERVVEAKGDYYPGDVEWQ